MFGYVSIPVGPVDVSEIVTGCKAMSKQECWLLQAAKALRSLCVGEEANDDQTETVMVFEGARNGSQTAQLLVVVPK